MALFLAALDQTIVATALPKIAQELHGLDLYTWVVTAYLLASTAMVPIYGKLSDIYGRKVIVLVGVALFLGGSATCGAARSMEWLIAWRGVQGLGAAAISSTAFAVVADLYEPRMRARVQGFFGAVFGLSSVVGPLLGGFLTDYVSWRWVFYVNLPLGAVVVLLILWKMPRLAAGGNPSIDWRGAALLVTGIVPILLSLSFDHQRHPWSSPETMLLLGGGAVGLVLFVWAESRAPSAILPLRLFKSPAFSICSLVSFFFGGAFFAAVLFIPMFMVRVVGVSATASGMTLMPLTLALVAAATTSGQVAAKLGRTKPLIVGALVVVAIGYFLFTGLTADSSRMDVTWRMVVLGIGVGPVLPLLTVSIQSIAQKSDLGIATASRQFFQQLGGVLGAALYGAVLAAVLATGMAERMAPLLAAAPPAVRQQLEQRLSSNARGGRDASAEAAMPPEVQRASKEAFTQAIVALFKWAFGTALPTLLVALFMREVRLGGAPAPAAVPDG